MIIRKGTRVYVLWEDITADLHSDETLHLATAETVGWVLRNEGKELELVTTRYVGSGACECKDRITIHKKVILKMERI